VRLAASRPAGASHKLRGMRALWIAPVAAGLLAGCLPVSSYHSARTLGEGESDFGVTFSSTSYRSADAEDPQTAVVIPGLIPELTYHIGVTDDVQVGGRVAPGFLYGELDLVYRFVHTPQLHVAVAPALGHVAAIGTLTSVRLPLLAAYELNDRFSVLGSVSGSSWVVSSVPDVGDVAPAFGAGERFFTMVGGSIGFEISGEVAYVRPSFEMNTMTFRPDGADRRVKTGALVLHIGRVGGREKKQLDRIEDKIDRLEESSE
jgi:hypothetical protein